LQEALELFSKKGYDASSVREICEAAGITKPTLYHFFGSKEGVYRALVDGTLEDFRGGLVDALVARGTAVDRLKRVARRYFAAARGRRQLMRFLFALVHNPPSSAPQTDFAKFYEEIVGLIARAVDDGVAAGELAPGSMEIRMLAFMGGLGEALCGWLITGRPELTDELADALVDTLMTGWAPR
jgi:TetR/AcrR family transcriptional regulator